MTMDRVAAGGIHLAFSERGAGEAVLLMHPGFVADGMLPLLSEPALEGFRAITYHRRGYGASDRPDAPAGIPTHAADALSLLDVLGVPRVHLVGTSFGALVAVQIALTTPERVASLTLMEPLLAFALDPSAAAYLDRTAQMAIPLFVSGDVEGAVLTWLTAAYGEGFRDVLEERLPGSWQQAVDDGGTAFASELPSLQTWEVGPAQFSDIRVPTLSLVHAGDQWSGFDQMHRFVVETVPGCDGVVVNVPSHLLQILDPRAVAEPVASFLARHPIRAV